MQKWLQPPACSDHGLHRMIRILSSYWLATFLWWKNPPNCSSILVWIAEWWHSSLTSRNPKNNWYLSRIFGSRFGEKDCGLSICKPRTEQAGGLEAFLHEAAQNFEVILNIQNWNQNKLKTYSGWCPFEGLPNGSTLMQIQSGRTVPLNRLWYLDIFRFHALFLRLTRSPGFILSLMWFCSSFRILSNVLMAVYRSST